jgi:hypothetical protein
MKLRRYNGLWNGNKEGSHNNYCVGLQGLKLGHRIYSGEGIPFTVIRFRKMQEI